MKRNSPSLLAIALIAILYTAIPLSAQISLGTAQSFGVPGGSTVTNTGVTTINANVGVSPGNAITGFPPGVVSPPGSIHAADVWRVRHKSTSSPLRRARASSIDLDPRQLVIIRGAPKGDLFNAIACRSTSCGQFRA